MTYDSIDIKLLGKSISLEPGMQVIQLSPDDKWWQVFVAHLKNSGDAQGVWDESGLPKEKSLLFLAVKVGEQIVGSLTLKKQPVTIPATDWAGERDRNLRGAGGGLIYEMFVQTFTVDQAYRRRGLGRALQVAALQKTKLLGCYQMRSWSSLDKHENYQLKLGMGFGFHPEIQETSSGLKVSGGYFVKVV